MRFKLFLAVIVALAIGTLLFIGKKESQLYSPEFIDNARANALPPGSVVLEKNDNWWKIEHQNKKYLCNFTHPSYNPKTYRELPTVVVVMLPVD